LDVGPSDLFFFFFVFNEIYNEGIKMIGCAKYQHAVRLGECRSHIFDEVTR